MRALWALALNGFKESRRNRVTVVVGLFAFVMIFAATVSLELTIFTFQRVLTDVGLGLMSLIAVFLAIFLSTALLPREIERRTIFLIVSKPVSRATFLVGRLLGNVATVTFVTLVMGGLFALQLVMRDVPVSGPIVVAIVGLLMEVVLLSSIGFFFSTFASQYVSAVCTVALFFTGHMASDLHRFAQHATTPATQLMWQVLYAVMPNLDRLDYKVRATYSIETPAPELLRSLGYGLSYSLVMVVLGCVLFERRDFK